MVVQVSYICASEHLFHNTEADSEKSVLSSPPIYKQGRGPKGGNVRYKVKSPKPGQRPPKPGQRPLGWLEAPEAWPKAWLEAWPGA